MRRTISLLLSLALMITCVFTVSLNAFSDTLSIGTCGDNLNWTLNEETGVLTISGSGDMYDYSLYSQGRVSKTYAPWCYSVTNGDIKIKNVVISEGVTSIGNHAFYMCENLSAVSFPESLERIGEEAFEGCAFTNVFIPCVEIGKGAFSMCKSLLRAHISLGTEAVPDSLFSGCTALYDIELPNTVTAIGASAFMNCGIAEIVIPDYVTTIGTNAFYGTGIRKIVIPSKVSAIPFGCFHFCTRLESVTFEGDITSIGNYAFRNCTSLKEFYVPKSVTSIGSYAFEVCTSLEKMEIPDTVTSIGNNAFRSDSLLTVYALSGSHAYEYAVSNGISVVAVEPEPDNSGVKGVSYEVINGKIYYTVTTSAGDYRRVKIAPAGNLNGYLVYSDSYTLNARGEYVWAMKGIAAPKEDISCAVDICSNKTNRYLGDYYYFDVDGSPIITSVTHERGGGFIYFTVTTRAWDFNRLKVSFKKDMQHYVKLVDRYQTLGDKMVWSFYIPEPEGESEPEYAFDFRTGANGKYLSDPYFYTAKLDQPVLSATHEKSRGYVTFTVVTAPDEYNRVRIVSLDNKDGYLVYTNNHTVDAQGNWVWTLQLKASDVEEIYGIDARTVSGRYVRDYYEYCVEHSIKSVECVETGTRLVFTVKTESGAYNRLRCGFNTTLADNIRTVDSCTEDENGNLVWVVNIPKPAQSATLYFDLRNSNTSNYIQDPFAFQYAV